MSIKILYPTYDYISVYLWQKTQFLLFYKAIYSTIRFNMFVSEQFNCLFCINFFAWYSFIWFLKLTFLHSMEDFNDSHCIKNRNFTYFSGV